VTDQANPRRPKRGSYQPKPETLALLKVSGNPINGVGETTPRRPFPFFWHPPDKHPWGGYSLFRRSRLVRNLYCRMPLDASEATRHNGAPPESIASPSEDIRNVKNPR
jgi:hypothetical protein